MERNTRLYIDTLLNLYAEYMMRMPGWMNHKMESRLPGEVSTTSDNTTLMAERAEGNGNPLQYSCLENPMDG